MSVKTLVSAEGALRVDALSVSPSDSDERLTVIATFAAHNLRHHQLLDNIFDTSFSSASQQGISVASVLGDDSAALAEPPHHAVVLSAEPTDGPDRDRDEERENIIHLSLAICDAVVFVVRMNELTRVNTNGMTALRGSITQMLLLQADRIIPTPTGKRAFFVVVRDYEADVVAREDIIAGFLAEMREVYADVARPPGVSSRITDLFEFEFFLLPSQQLETESYTEQVDELRTRLLDPTSDDYLFENGRFSRPAETDLGEIADKAWKKLNTDVTGDIPPAKDLMSAFDCDNAMRNVFEKYQRGVRVWRRETDGGVIIEKFGDAASNMVEKTMTVYEKDAAPHKGSKAFRRKKDELRELLDADLYSLFVVQIGKLREVTYRRFKEDLSSIEEQEQSLERAVNGVLREAQREFAKNAQELKPRIASWRYDKDTKELATQMREDATERLQRARLEDYQEHGGRRSRRRRQNARPFGSKKRQPISIGLHYLDPAPFGWKDSRYEKLSVDDNLQFKGGSPDALIAPKGGGHDGLTVPIAPTDQLWKKRNQEFIYTERK